MTIEELGGYRIIRKLGEGARTEVFLGRADDPEAPPVALKSYRPGVPATVALVEIEALHLAAGPHVQRLLDIAPAHDGMPVLVLERLSSGGLEGLLRSRERLAAGEAITILAPLAEALARLHDEGVLHGAVTARAVLFSADGAPVLSCFGRAMLVEPGLSRAARDADPGFAADLAGFAGLARDLLDGVPGIDAIGLLESPGSLRDFAERLFALGEATPVRFGTSEQTPAVPARLVRGEPVQQPLEPARPSAALALPEWIERRLPEVVPPLLARLRAMLAPVRARVWVAAGAAAVALVSAIILVPSGGDSGAEPVLAASPSATAPPDDSPVVGDDPVSAVVALLEARERCIRDLSVLCLDAVDQAGSAALADDQALVRSLQDGAELVAVPAPDRDVLVLVERLGDSAIVSLGPDSEPASILLMRGEAGWRFRQYLAG